MKNNYEDILGTIPRTRKAKRPVQSLGTLHDLLGRAVPDCSKGGLCNLQDLAVKLDLSFQAVYQWVKRNSIPPKQARRIIELSNKSVKRPSDFEPATPDDFWPFLS